MTEARTSTLDLSGGVLASASTKSSMAAAAAGLEAAASARLASQGLVPSLEAAASARLTSQELVSSLEAAASARLTSQQLVPSLEAAASGLLTGLAISVNVRIVEPRKAKPPPLWIPPLELYGEEGEMFGFLADFTVSRSYLISQISSGGFSCAPDHTAVSLGWVDPDNLVLVRSKFGLPDWLGVILEVEFSLDKVTAKCEEALSLLTRWNGFGLPVGEYVGGLPEETKEMGTVMSIVAGMITRTNARFESGVRLGDLNLDSGRYHTVTHGKDRSILDVMQDLQRAEDFDFWTEPFFDDSGRLRARLNLVRKRRRDRRRWIQLWEGYNVGRGARYKRLSTQHGYPTAEIFSLSVADTDLWQYLEPGDVIGVHFANLGAAGVETDVRVLGYEADEDEALLRLVTEEA